RRVPVTVWNLWGQPVGPYLVDGLRQLGYQAPLRNVSGAQFYATAGNASRKIQLGITGWAANVPTASDFFLPVLTCRSFSQDPSITSNLTQFCHPHTDDLARQA